MSMDSRDNDHNNYLNWCKDTGRKPSELAFGYWFWNVLEKEGKKES